MSWKPKMRAGRSFNCLLDCIAIRRSHMSKESTNSPSAQPESHVCHPSEADTLLNSDLFMKPRKLLVRSNGDELETSQGDLGLRCLLRLLLCLSRGERDRERFRRRLSPPLASDDSCGSREVLPRDLGISLGSSAGASVPETRPLPPVCDAAAVSANSLS